MRTIKKEVKDFLFLQSLFLYFSIIGIFTKKASTYNLFSYDFFKIYLIIISMLMLYAFLWQLALKKYSLFVAYSSKGMVILWSFLWAVIFFQEEIRLNNVIGAVIVITGIILVSKDE